MYSARRRNQEPSTSARKIMNMKRAQSWKTQQVSKKLKFSEFKNLAAHEMRRFDTFQQWLQDSTFYFHNIAITGEISIVDDIVKCRPLNYPSKCHRCQMMKQRNDLLGDIGKIRWKELKYSDMPDDVPLGVRTLVISFKSMLTHNSDDVSSKAFTRHLLETVKTYWMCQAHATNCDIIIPKKVEDIGAFEFDVEVEQILMPPTSDTSSSSDRSRSPTCRKSPRILSPVIYSEAEISSNENEVEASESGLEEREIVDVSLKADRPSIIDSVRLSGIPDVVMMNVRKLTIVVAEDKFMKDIPSVYVHQSDVGQLLFYMFSIAIKGVTFCTY
ncbi:PREDICTED: uncharacterized protein LOC109591515, partial [Amphimedon queenslandica]|uniref:Uncharacterized protein n=2 Tax=Amphimedon queenslandica TaxID=400682 RepID=A0AAN0K0V9_AMPQE